MASTIGYWMLIGLPQVRHRPRSASHESTGMLSYQTTMVPHLGQRERGVTTDSCRGNRYTHTLSKLPSSAPNSPAMPARISSGDTQQLVEQDAGGDRGVERFGVAAHRDRDGPRRDVLPLF